MIATVLHSIIEPSNRRTVEPPNRRTAELAPVFAVLRGLKAARPQP